MSPLPLRIILLVGLICYSYALKSQAPNVILIVSDDQGYGDLSCLGNPVIETPNLDKLHAESVRLTDFHVDPTCAPTRAALITGKYSHHVGVWHTVSGGNHLRATETTMADVFKANGYRTGLFGKWHLGSNYPYRPMDRGFDKWLGQGDGGTGTTDDWFYNDRVNDHYWYNGKRVKREGFAPDVFFDSAIDFIEEESNKPFFLYLATYLPHDPHTLPDQSMADKYKGKVADYISYFFSGIDRIDQNIGRLRKVLEDAGISKNTILIFMTDNGGTAGVNLYNAGMRGHKGQIYEGGHRVPFFMHWPNGNLKQGSDMDQLTAHIDVLPTLIDLCGLSTDKKTEYDGLSIASQLKNPDTSIPERTLFVETQRNFIPMPWLKTAGMMGKWRLVDNKALYDVSTDPGQKKNVIGAHPLIVKSIQKAHKKYWKNVTPRDRDAPYFIVGHPKDPEVFLNPSDWHLTNGPWNHSQVARGNASAGSWHITVSKKGRYRFEVSRWPREAKTPIKAVPRLDKQIDAWTANGPVDKLIYGKEMRLLPVQSIKLKVGEYEETKKVSLSDLNLTFEMELDEGNLTVQGVMLDASENIIAGAYYVYVTRLD